MSDENEQMRGPRGECRPNTPGWGADDAESEAERVEHLRKVAEAADDGGREWTWLGGYPQAVLVEGPVTLVADCFEDPDRPSRFAEFIATFDPPTILSILTALSQERQLREEAERRAEDAEEKPTCIGEELHGLNAADLRKAASTIEGCKLVDRDLVSRLRLAADCMDRT